MDGIRCSHSTGAMSIHTAIKGDAQNTQLVYMNPSMIDDDRYI
jgi:hypothetical protein